MVFGVGGFMETLSVEIAHLVVDNPDMSYGIVFATEGLLLLFAAMLAHG